MRGWLESELLAALAGLGPSERLELLGLLEQRERVEVEQALDTRKPISEYAEEALHVTAQQSEEPAAYLAAHARYEARCDEHFERLVQERPLADDATVQEFLTWFMDLVQEAERLVEADG
jgi:hypothetical protein